MATFTIEVREVREILERTGDPIGLEDYPIFDESYREGLNAKILDHFHYREIGYETIDQYVFALRRRMREIMPYFNQRYTSTLHDADMLSTIDMESTSSGQGQSSTESTAKGRSVVSDTPQVQLAGNGDYATGISDNASENDTTASTSDTSTSRTSGRNAPAAALIQLARETMINVDMEVITALEDLHMSIWNTNDSYTNGWTI